MYIIVYTKMLHHSLALFIDDNHINTIRSLLFLSTERLYSIYSWEVAALSCGNIPRILARYGLELDEDIFAKYFVK